MSGAQKNADRSPDAPAPALSPGQAAAFMKLFASHQRRLFGFVYTLVRNEADADDVLQEALTVMWAKFNGFEPGSDFAAWAMKIARLKAMELFAHRRRDQALFTPATMELVADRMEQMGDRGDRVHDALSSCLGKLPARDRELIEARYQRGQSTDSVAERFGRSRSQMYRTLGRIYNALLACIEHNIDASTPGESKPTGGTR